MTKLAHLLPPMLAAQHQYYQIRLNYLDEHGNKVLDEGFLYNKFAPNSRPKNYDAIVAREHSPGQKPLYDRMETGHFDILRNPATGVDNARK